MAEDEAKKTGEELEHEDEREEDAWQPTLSEVKEVKSLMGNLAEQVRASNQRAQDQETRVQQLVESNQELTKQLQETNQSIRKLSTPERSPSPEPEPSPSTKTKSEDDPPKTEEKPPHPAPPERPPAKRRSI